MKPSPFINEISERELTVIFNMSMMLNQDVLNYDRHMKMSMVEFVEGLARIADKTSPIREHEDITPADRAKLPL